MLENWGKSCVGKVVGKCGDREQLLGKGADKFCHKLLPKHVIDVIQLAVRRKCEMGKEGRLMEDADEKKGIRRTWNIKFRCLKKLNACFLNLHTVYGVPLEPPLKPGTSHMTPATSLDNISMQFNFC